MFPWDHGSGFLFPGTITHGISAHRVGVGPESGRCFKSLCSEARALDTSRSFPYTMPSPLLSKAGNFWEEQWAREAASSSSFLSAPLIEDFFLPPLLLSLPLFPSPSELSHCPISPEEGKGVGIGLKGGRNFPGKPGD